ncbi:MAG: hypothetical protein NT075_28260 [Chloroflexi bacterium]|nr:hypothetical protein [Chloroflexota bacterium]
MDYQIILVYCLCADLLNALAHKEDPQCQISDAEVMTSGLVAALYFGGNHSLACTFLQEQGYMPTMVSKSQFSRRLHRLDDLLITLFRVLGESFKPLNETSVYTIDSAPIAACDNIRIRRNKLYGDEAHRGYQASKRRYFYGVKIHLLVTKDQPIFNLPLTARRIRNARCSLGCASSFASIATRWKRPIVCTLRVPGAFCPSRFMP